MVLRGKEVYLEATALLTLGHIFISFVICIYLAAIPTFGKVADRWRLEPDTHFSSVLTPVLNLDIDGILLSPSPPAKRCRRRNDTIDSTE